MRPECEIAGRAVASGGLKRKIIGERARRGLVKIVSRRYLDISSRGKLENVNHRDCEEANCVADDFRANLRASSGWKYRRFCNSANLIYFAVAQRGQIRGQIIMNKIDVDKKKSNVQVFQVNVFPRCTFACVKINMEQDDETLKTEYKWNFNTPKL